MKSLSELEAAKAKPDPAALLAQLIEAEYGLVIASLSVRGHLLCSTALSSVLA